MEKRTLVGCLLSAPFKRIHIFEISPHSSRKVLLLISLALIHGQVSLRKVHSRGFWGWHGVGEEQVIKFC